MPRAHRAKLPGYGRFFDAPNRMIEMIFSGVFDRFPELQIVFAEVDFGWVPYVKEQIDNNYLRLAVVNGYELELLPSEYIERHFHFGLHDRHVRASATASASASSASCGRRTTRTSAPTGRTRGARSKPSFSGVPRAERDLILAGNAARLYGFTSSEPSG